MLTHPPTLTCIVAALAIIVCGWRPNVALSWRPARLARRRERIVMMAISIRMSGK